MIIRIKGKHLIYSGVILLAIILIIANFGGHLIYQYANLLNKMGYTDKANVYYSRVSNLYAQNSSGLMAEYRRVQNILVEGNFRFSTTFASLSGGSIYNSGFIGYKTVDSVNEQYEILKMNKKVSRTMMGEYTLGVALVNWFGGRVDKAVGLLESFKPEEERVQELRKLHLSNMYFYLGETEKSQQVISGMKPLEGLTYYQEDIKGLNQLFTGDPGKITFDREIIYTFDGNVDCLVEPLKFTRNFIETINSFTMGSKTNTKGNVLTGRIMYEGIPQKNIMVFIKQAEFKNTWTSSGTGDGKVGLGISDEDGYFEIANIPDGAYGMVLEIPWQRITGKNIVMHSGFDMIFKGNTSRNEDIALLDPISLEVTSQDKEVTFKWHNDIFPDDSYSLVLSELEEKDGILCKTNNSHYSQQIRGNEVTFNVEELQKTAYRLGFTYGDKPDPKEYIEPLYHTGQYGYTLYNYAGNDMLYFSSEGIQPNQPWARLTIQGSEWAKEDLLLLDGKFEEARVAYEALLEKEPENIHALKVLSRMYDFGYIAPEGGGFIDDLEGKNKMRAMELLQRLDNLVDSNDIKSALADQYREVKQYQKAIELLNILQDRTPSPYIDIEIGRLHLYMNKFQESVEYFTKSTEYGNNGALNLILMGVLLNDNELLSEGASQCKMMIRTNINDLTDAYIKMDKSDYQKFFELVRQNKIPEAQEWLSKRNGEMDEFLKAALLLTRDTQGMKYEEKDNLYRERHQRIKNPILDELLIYLGREFISSAYMTPYDH